MSIAALESPEPADDRAYLKQFFASDMSEKCFFS